MPVCEALKSVRNFIALPSSIIGAPILLPRPAGPSSSSEKPAQQLPIETSHDESTGRRFRFVPPTRGETLPLNSLRNWRGFCPERRSAISMRLQSPPLPSGERGERTSNASLSMERKNRAGLAPPTVRLPKEEGTRAEIPRLSSVSPDVQSEFRLDSSGISAFPPGATVCRKQQRE